MGLSALYAVPQTPDDWNAWTFNHAAIHYDIVGAIAQQKKQNLTQFCLNPIGDLGMWLYWHASMHNQANAALGTKGNDLLDLDLQDAEQLNEWLLLNGSEHQSWNAILGV